MVPERKETRELDNVKLINSDYFNTKELYELLFMQKRDKDRNEKISSYKAKEKKKEESKTIRDLNKSRKSILMRSDTY